MKNEITEYFYRCNNKLCFLSNEHVHYTSPLSIRCHCGNYHLLGVIKDIPQSGEVASMCKDTWISNKYIK